MESTSFDEIIEGFALRRKNPFCLDDVLSHLESKGLQISPKVERRVASALRSSSFVFADGIDGYTPRHAVFTDAKFMISPTREEIDAGILIPGHRFVPFLCPEVFPWGCRLATSHGIKTRRKKIKRKITDLLIYYTLFGLENLPAILLADSQQNEKAILEPSPESEAVITVFSMQQLYREWEFREGDGFLLTVRSWKEGDFVLEHVSREDRNADPEGEKEWISRLEEGFDITFDTLGISAEMPDQIAYAFYYGGSELLENPAIHLGGFLSKSDFLGFQKLGRDTYLWRNGEDLQEQYISSFEPKPPTGADDSLEAILDDIGVSLSTEELEAYMRDELFHRRDSLSAVAERCLSGRAGAFVDLEQEEAFHRFLESLWDEVKEEYNFFTDQAGGRLREKALRIFDAHISWMRDLDRKGVQLENLPAQKLLASFQIAADMSAFVTQLNREENIAADQAAQMHEALDSMEKALAEYHDEIGKNTERG